MLQMKVDEYPQIFADLNQMKEIYFCYVTSYKMPSFYLLKFNNGNNRIMCETCLKLTMKTPERCQLCSSGDFVTFEHISQIVLVFALLVTFRN